MVNPDGPGFVTPPGFTTPFYLNGIYIGGENGYPHGLVKNYWKTVQPRVGFSYDIFGNGRTVLRGGFGTFYERLQGNDIYNTGTNPPFYYDPSASNVYFTNPHTSWVSGLTANTPTFPQGLTTLDPYYPAPAVAQFSLGVQHEIAPSIIWIVQYVGNVAWSQNIDNPINNYPLSTPNNIRADAGDGSNKSGTNPPRSPTCPTCDGHSLANANLYRTYQGFAGITQQQNTTNGSYNGFQTGLRLQNKWGLSGEVDYTWSHEIDITSYDLATISNPFNVAYDYGSGALDRRHILVANYIYDLPFFKGGSGLTHSLLGGWQVAGTFVAESGYLGALQSNQGVGLSVGYDPVGLGGGYTNRPNVSRRPRAIKNVKQWFDTSVFSAPTPSWAGGPNLGFGNARKDIVVGPGRENFTTSLYKTFDIKEVAHIELRFESFNTFNHTEFMGVNSNYNGPNQAGNFGAINSTWDPRVLQLGGKFSF